MKTHTNPSFVLSSSAFGRSVPPASIMAVGLLAAALLGGVSARAATTYNWINSSEADYATPGNWSPSGPPGSADIAVLGNATLANGTIDFTSGDTYTLNTLQMGNVAGTTVFNMSGGTFTINKSGTDGFKLGGAASADATFNLSNGTFTVIRPSTYYQDCVTPGNAANSTGEINIYGGTASFICGVEIGYNGIGTITIDGGNVYGTGWWNAGRGSNGGNTSQNQGSGIFNLKSGTLWLQQTNSSLGNKGLYIQQTATNGIANISGGTLVCEGIRVMNANSLAAGATPPTATLNVSGGDLFLGAVGVLKPGSLSSGVATVNLSGGTFHTTNSLSPGGDEDWVWNANLPANLNTSPGSGVVTFAPGVGRTITLSNDFSGDGGLTVAGPGTVDIEGANTYNGNTTLNGGTVSGFGSVQQSDVTANSGATIAPGSSTAPGTLSLGYNLTLNGATNIVKLSGDPYSPGVNDLLFTYNNLTLQNVTTIKVVPLAPLSVAAPYLIMQYGGTALTAGDAAHLHVTSDSARYGFSVVDPSTTYPYVQINVTGNSANLLWQGGTAPSPNDWDHTTLNWSNTTSMASDVFYNGDVTVFDDSASITSVNVTGSEQPASMTMSNNSKSFTFGGSGTLSGALDMEGTASLTLGLSTTPSLTTITHNAGTLVFNLANGLDNTISAVISDNGGGAGTIIQGGTNTLVLSGDNLSYNGTLAVTNGVLQYATANALGYYAAPLYVTNNGTLDFNHVNLLSKPIIISGSGFNGQGAVNDSNPSASGAHVVLNYLILSNTASIGSQGRWDMSGLGSVTGNGFNLTKVGNGVAILDGGSDSGLGDIEVTAGRLAFQHACTPGTAGTLTVDSAAQLTFYALSAPASKNMSLMDGSLVDSGGGANTVTGSVTLAGTNTFATRRDLHLSGAIGGAGGLTVATNSSIGGGNGALYLESADNTYSGVTILNQGATVYVAAGSSLGTSSFISLNTGSTLDVSALDPLTLGSGQTLVGIGTIAGDLDFGSGSTLSVGLSATATATLTMNGILTFLAGSTNVAQVNPGTGASDLVTGLTSVTYGGTLKVAKVGAGSFAAGNSFQLFSAGTYNASSFSAYDLPALDPTLDWDASHLAADGTIRVIARPQISDTTLLSDGNIALTFSADISSPSYTLWATTNVAKPLVNWDMLSSGPITSNPMTVQDLHATNYPQRFYTISVP